MSLTKVLQLNEEGYLVGDYIVGYSGPAGKYPDNWTADEIPADQPGYYAARYSGTRNDSTGEWTGGAWYEGGHAPEETVAQAHAEMMMLLTADFTAAVKKLEGTYPPKETDTWTVQLTEAKAYDAWRQAGRVGDEPEIPFLRQMSEERTAFGVGAGLEDLVDRVLRNNDYYSPNMAKTVARRHAGEQALYIALQSGDAKTVRAVKWSFEL